MTAFSDYLEVAFLRATFKGITFTGLTAVFVSAHSAAPDEDGSPTNELTTAVAPGYARLSIANADWAEPYLSGDSHETTNLVTATLATATGAWPQVTHVGIWDALTAGNPLYFGALNTPRSVGSGQALDWPAGTLIVKLR